MESGIHTNYNRNKSSDDERLFMIYKDLAITSVVNILGSNNKERIIKERCEAHMAEARIIMQVFNERNLNEPTNQ